MNGKSDATKCARFATISAALARFAHGVELPVLWSGAWNVWFRLTVWAEAAPIAKNGRSACSHEDMTSAGVRVAKYGVTTGGPTALTDAINELRRRLEKAC